MSVDIDFILKNKDKIQEIMEDYAEMLVQKHILDGSLDYTLGYDKSTIAAYKDAVAYVDSVIEAFCAEDKACRSC